MSREERVVDIVHDWMLEFTCHDMWKNFLAGSTDQGLEDMAYGKVFSVVLEPAWRHPPHPLETGQLANSHSQCHSPIAMNSVSVLLLLSRNASLFYFGQVYDDFPLACVLRSYNSLKCV